MAYAATSLSLAAMEVFVHLSTEDIPRELVSVEAELPLEAASCERIEVRTLPSDWRNERNVALPRIGAAWARSLRSLALLVPSAAVEGEWNVLINPEHPDAKLIQFAAPRPFRFDERMFRVRR